MQNESSLLNIRKKCFSENIRALMMQQDNKTNELLKLATI